MTVLERAERALVKVAEVLSGGKLVEVSAVHISGVSYLTIRDAGLHFLEELAESGARFRVPATVNPAGVDPLHLSPELRETLPHDFVEKQCRILHALEKLGAELTLTCTPYLYRDFRNQVVAWGESSAVIYGNTVLGLRTDRWGGPLTVLAAVVGKVPETKLYRDEGRYPTHVVEVRVGQRYPWSLVGYCIGTVLRSGTPYLKLRGVPQGRELRNFLAALATPSNINRCVLPGLTPDLVEPRGRVPEVVITEEDLRRICEDLELREEPDCIALGCPHYSYEDLREILSILVRLGSRVRYPVLVFVSRVLYQRLLQEEKVLLEKLRKYGVDVVSGTCIVVSPLCESLGYRHVLTDSAKAAHYLRTLHRCRSSVTDLETCLRVATGAVRPW